MAELSAEDRERLSAYSGLVQGIWEDDDFKGRALADPRAALAEHGWEVPEGAEVRIEVIEFDESTLQDPPSNDEIATSWREGLEADELVVVVPTAPAASEPETISDEQLAGVDGGGNPLYGNVCVCIGG
jgi:hypothetical protein